MTTKIELYEAYEALTEADMIEQLLIHFVSQNMIEICSDDSVVYEKLLYINLHHYRTCTEDIIIAIQLVKTSTMVEFIVLES